MFFTCGSGVRSATARGQQRRRFMCIFGRRASAACLSIPLERPESSGRVHGRSARDLQELHFEALRRVRVLLNRVLLNSDSQSTTDDRGPAHL